MKRGRSPKSGQRHLVGTKNKPTTTKSKDNKTRKNSKTLTNQHILLSMGILLGNTLLSSLGKWLGKKKKNKLVTVLSRSWTSRLCLPELPLPTTTTITSPPPTGKCVLLLCMTAHTGFSARSVVPESYSITEGFCSFIADNVRRGGGSLCYPHRQCCRERQNGELGTAMSCSGKQDSQGPLSPSPSLRLQLPHLTPCSLLLAYLKAWCLMNGLLS